MKFLLRCSIKIHRSLSVRVSIIEVLRNTKTTYPISSAGDRNTFLLPDCRYRREISSSVFWYQVLACNRTRRYHFALACRVHSSRRSLSIALWSTGRQAGRSKCRVGREAVVGRSLVNLHAPGNSRRLIREIAVERNATAPGSALRLNRPKLGELAIYVGR